MMISCADSVRDDNSWTYLERAEADRSHNYLPSSPRIVAWAVNEMSQANGNVLASRWTVPADFQCDGNVVGRWVWKTGNTCYDANNIGRPTETFSLEEFRALVQAYDPYEWLQNACEQAPETFIS